jgi:hypothetical protein
VPLPAFVVDLVRKLPPKSPKYFLWTGTSTIKTAVNDWSEKMRQLYVEAGIEGKHTHEWRDTPATEALEGGGKLEDVQLLLGHKSRKTTEKYYVAVTKKRMEIAIEASAAHIGCRHCRAAFPSRQALFLSSERESAPDDLPAPGSWPVIFCHSRAKILTGIVNVR